MEAPPLAPGLLHSPGLIAIPWTSVKRRANASRDVLSYCRLRISVISCNRFHRSERVGKRMIILLLLVRVVVFVLGAYLVFRACLSALRTFVLPRSAPDRFNRTTFIVVRQLFEWRSNRLQAYLERDRAIELYAPVALLARLVVWLFSINLGYIAMDWAIAAQSWYVAFKISGSSLLTLGFALVDNFPSTLLVFSEATIGLILSALLIPYLPL